MSSPDTQALEALLARVEGATGPDRQLDYAIFMATAVMEAANPWSPNKGNFFTSSLDAIVALIEHEMPKSRWETGRYWIMRFDAWGATAHVDCPVAVESHYTKQPFNPISTGRTAPLALCAAFLRARIAMERNDGE